MYVVSVSFLLLFVSSCFAGEQDVLELGDSDFSTRVAEYNTLLVMFYAPW